MLKIAPAVLVLYSHGNVRYHDQLNAYLAQLCRPPRVVSAAALSYVHFTWTKSSTLRFSDLQDRTEQRRSLSEVQDAFTAAALDAMARGVDVAGLLKSPVELQCELALGENIRDILWQRLL